MQIFHFEKRIQNSSAMVSGDYFMFLFHLTKSSCSCRQSIGQNVILSSNSLPTLSSSQQQSKRTIFSNYLQQYSSTTILNELIFTIILLLHFLHLNKANFPPNISSVQWRHNKEIHQEVCDIF